MDFKSLMHAIALADEGSFVRAADKVALSQSAMSRSILTLEKTLGTVLFDRTPGGVRPTRAGQALVARARKIVADVRTLRNELEQARTSISGRVAFGAVPALAVTCLPDLLTHCVQHWPQLGVTATLPPKTYPSYYEEYIETMPRSELERMQEGLLLQLAPYVYARSALVRQAWDAAGVTPQDIHSLDDFRNKVPFIDKDTIRAFRDTHKDPFGGLKCVDAPHLRAVGFTSGTTGDPTPLPFSRSVTVPQMKRDYWHIGMRPGDYFALNLFTFREGQGTLCYTDCDFRPISSSHSPLALPDIFEATRRYQPKLMCTVSLPLLLAMEDLARKQDLDLKSLFSCYQGFIFGGEPPSPRIKQLVASWGVELFEITSLGDAAGAIDCRAHAGFHAWEDLVFVECLQPNGSAPMADGEIGELVVTSLHDDVAPLVRYRTDDLITFTKAPCSCGRTHGRIQMLGRKGDQILINGRSVLPRDITPIVEEIPETIAGLYQIVRPGKEMDTLRLRVGYNPELLRGATDELAARVRERVAMHLEVPVQVELTPNSELLKLGPPHKIPRVTKK